MTDLHRLFFGGMRVLAHTQGCGVFNFAERFEHRIHRLNRFTQIILGGMRVPAHTQGGEVLNFAERFEHRLHRYIRFAQIKARRLRRSHRFILYILSICVICVLWRKLMTYNLALTTN